MNYGSHLRSGGLESLHGVHQRICDPFTFTHPSKCVASFWFSFKPSKCGIETVRCQKIDKVGHFKQIPRPRRAREALACAFHALETLGSVGALVRGEEAACRFHQQVVQPLLSPQAKWRRKPLHEFGGLKVAWIWRSISLNDQEGSFEIGSLMDYGRPWIQVCVKIEDV